MGKGWSDARVLVTGAAGFLGVPLVCAVARRGARVDALDLSHPVRASSLWGRHADRVRMLTGDVRTFQGGEALDGYDVVFNLAAHASPPTYKAQRVATLETCAVGTQRMLGMVRTGGVFVQASTSEVYGDAEVIPTPESYRGSVSSTGPRSCYDEGKRYAEAMCAAAAVELGVDARVARIFNSYGPTMSLHDGRMLPAFALAMLRGGMPEVHGTGQQTRSLCYADDTVAGLIRLAEADVGAYPGPHPIPVLNIGGDDEHTVEAIAARCIVVARELGWRCEGSLAHVEQPCPDDPTRRRPDVGIASEWLGWEPRIALGMGLRRTFVSFALQFKSDPHGKNRIA